MKSMTGYGKGVSERDNKTLTVEIKAVNNRFLEINARLPKYLTAGDEIVRKEIGSVIKRGSIDFFFDYKDLSGDKTLDVDYELASHYADAAEKLSKELDIENGLTASYLLKFNDIVTVTSQYQTDLLLEMLKEATVTAVKNLDTMRSAEGAQTRLDFIRLTDNIEAHLKAVKAKVPSVIEEYREKLKKRIEDYLGEVELDQSRLLNEVAFFADKSDINEEISRLTSHIAQFRSAIDDQSEVGRKLDFLAQEMNREINTMGSKSGDVELTGHVLAMKNELEKIREQIRNIE